MVEVSAVKDVLRHLDATVSPLENGDFAVACGEDKSLLRNLDMELYLSRRTSIKRPVPPAIFFPGFYEHAVDIQGPSPSMFRLFRNRVEDAIALESKDKNRRITLAPASLTFILAQLDSNDPSNRWRNILPFSSMRHQTSREGRKDDLGDFRRLFPRMLTVRVETSDDDEWAGKHSKLRSLAEAMLFHVTYAEGIGLTLTGSWERDYYRLGLRRNSELQFPLRIYNHELLAYYSLAFGTDSLLLAYIALYKILEYFFTASSEKPLLCGIAAKLVEPDFSYTKEKKLRELTKIIRSHDAKFNERRLLQAVLEDHLNIAEVRDWITEFDKQNSAYFTTERNVFAKDMKVDISDDELFPTIATRIYHIRNVLVHNKEGEDARFIPFSGQEKDLRKEIPLLLYLAERLIITDGKDI